MENKITIKRFAAFTLAAVMSAQIFAGCSKQENKSHEETDDEFPIKASSVAFSEKGDYRTTITSNKIDLSDIKTGDISVTYDFIDEDGYNKAVEKAEKEYEDKLKSINEEKSEKVSKTDSETKSDAESKSTEEAAAEALSDEDFPEMDVIPMGDYMKEKSVDVKSVKAEKNKLELSFTDPNASNNLVGYYNIYLKGKKYDN